jgi:Tol biopolymer transport system component
MKRSCTWLVLAGALALALECARPERAPGGIAQPTRRVSNAARGSQANGASGYPSISADGRCIAFASVASNLVAGDENELGDVFVADVAGSALVCASVAPNGRPATGESHAPSISGDGLRVVFVSDAADLVDGDQNHAADVFLRDLRARTTTRVSVSAAGAEADGASYAPRISTDGRWVAFASQASNLVPRDTNGQPDVFLRDLQGGTLERISFAAGGGDADGASEGPALSSDGRYVAFASTALNLVPGENPAGATRVWDVYRRDRAAGTIVRVSASVSGGKGDGHSFAPAISADGRCVAFASHARNLISSDLDERADVFVRDLRTGTTQRVSVGLGGLEPTGDSLRPSISADGRFVSFESSAGNLVAEPRPEGSTWVYLRDLSKGTTTRSGGNADAALSADGRWIAFSAVESGLEDLFVRGPLR